MIRELTLDILGLLVGILFIAWSTYMLIRRRHRVVGPTRETGPAPRRIPLAFIIVILLIGLGDTYKAAKDLMRTLRKLDPHPAAPPHGAPEAQRDRSETRPRKHENAQLPGTKRAGQ